MPLPSSSKTRSERLVARRSAADASALSARNVAVPAATPHRAHATRDGVHGVHAKIGRRRATARVRHDDRQRHLAKERGLSAHVRAGQRDERRGGCVLIGVGVSTGAGGVLTGAVVPERDVVAHESVGTERARERVPRPAKRKAISSMRQILVVVVVKDGSDETGTTRARRETRRVEVRRRVRRRAPSFATRGEGRHGGGDGFGGGGGGGDDGVAHVRVILGVTPRRDASAANARRRRRKRRRSRPAPSATIEASATLENERMRGIDSRRIVTSPRAARRNGNEPVANVARVSEDVLADGTETRESGASAVARRRLAAAATTSAVLRKSRVSARRDDQNATAASSSSRFGSRSSGSFEPGRRVGPRAAPASNPSTRRIPSVSGNRFGVSSSTRPKPSRRVRARLRGVFERLRQRRRARDAPLRVRRNRRERRARVRRDVRTVPARPPRRVAPPPRRRVEALKDPLAESTATGARDGDVQVRQERTRATYPRPRERDAANER